MSELSFASRIGSYVHGAFASICISLATELGIFDVFRDAKEEHLSAADIANKGNLKERYIELKS